jgi:methylmalonyl-CoA mutase cobalamin-binding subunit
LGARIVPEALRNAGMDVITLAEAGYANDAEDAAWIPEVAAQ